MENSKIIEGEKSEPRKENGHSPKLEKDFQRNRRPIFEYPELPRLELLFYFLVTCSSIIYAWSRIYIASRKYIWNLNGIWEAHDDVRLPYLGTHRRDATETEWEMWKMWMYRILPWMVGHSFLFNVGELFLPKWLWTGTMLAYWIAAHVVAVGKTVITVSLFAGCLVYTSARFTRSKSLAWIVGIGFLYWSTASEAFITFDEHGFGYYIIVLIFPYKTLQFLTFITEMIDDRKNREIANEKEEKSISEEEEKKKPTSKWEDPFFTGLYKMYWYSFYLPYSCHLIVIYKRFPKQIASRATKTRNWSEILTFGLRVAFWALLAEVVGYVFYFEAMMQNWQYLQTVTEDTLVSIGYATGQFFHLKYVIVFGVVAFFAKVDKMEPFEGPICIARVSLYAKIWRSFDRGLYDFFKEYIFLPICRPTFSISRKIVGVFVSYSFVVIWHGPTHQYIVWVILNICELFEEIIAKVLYSIPCVRQFRENHISDRNFRRILAWLQIVTFAFGLYSNFYFLGSSESGYVFVERIFWEETVPVHWPFILLICLGYCYCHVCMEVDRRYGIRARQLEMMKNKGD